MRETGNEARLVLVGVVAATFMSSVKGWGRASEWGLKKGAEKAILSPIRPGRASELVSDGAGGSAAVVHTRRV